MRCSPAAEDPAPPASAGAYMSRRSSAGLAGARHLLCEGGEEGDKGGDIIPRLSRKGPRTDVEEDVHVRPHRTACAGLYRAGHRPRLRHTHHRDPAPARKEHDRDRDAAQLVHGRRPRGGRHHRELRLRLCRALLPEEQGENTRAGRGAVRHKDRQGEPSRGVRA